MGILRSLRSILGADRKLDLRERFEIERELGSGTMSRFFRVRDLQTSEVFGLKLLDVAKTASFEARFAGLNKPSEGEIAIRFDHPNLVRTYEYGMTTENTPWLLMEYLDGTGVNQLLQRKDPILERRGVKQAMIRQLAEGLAYIHQRQFLHRDLCSRNLILSPDGRTLKLIDFGLSIPMTPPFLKPGNRTGTVNYMAPELIRRQAIDVRVDVFAFGVTCYEIITGHLPWDSVSTAQNSQNASQHQAIMRRAAVHARPLAEVAPDTDAELARAIDWCLEPDRDHRCPNMRTFLRHLHDTLH
ncbi:MAG: serine/threonine-protein kinase [Planctomycetia bacterium]|nr:serine/threonine-protein kinase [Planctomycetia bacterium]